MFVCIVIVLDYISTYVSMFKRSHYYPEELSMFRRKEITMILTVVWTFILAPLIRWTVLRKCDSDINIGGCMSEQAQAVPRLKFKLLIMFWLFLPT